MIIPIDINPSNLLTFFETTTGISKAPFTSICDHLIFFVFKTLIAEVSNHQFCYILINN